MNIKWFKTELVNIDNQIVDAAVQLNRSREPSALWDYNKERLMKLAAKRDRVQGMLEGMLKAEKLNQGMG